MADTVTVVPGGIPSASLYVDDLDRNVTDEFFFDLFNSVAPVISFNICRGRAPPRTQSPLCHAFVNFQNIQDATDALTRLFFTKINGKPIIILFFPYTFSKKAKVYVERLNFSIDQEKFYRIFSIFGTILSCKVAIDDNGIAKGHGFVQFEHEESSLVAMNTINGVPINGRRIYVKPFMTRVENIQRKRSLKLTDVCVKNLPQRTTSKDLQNLFSIFGSIVSARVQKDKYGKPRCYGFVSFERSDAAAAAVLLSNSCNFGGRTLYIERFKSKAERHAEGEVRIGQEMMGQPPESSNLDESVDKETLSGFFSEDEAFIATPRLHDGTSGFPPGALKYGLISPSTTASCFPQRLLGMPPERDAEAELRIGQEMMGQPPESANLYVKNLNEKVDEETLIEFFSEVTSSKRLFAQDEASTSTACLHYGTSEFPPGAPKSLYYETFGLIPPPTAASGFPRRLLGMPSEKDSGVEVRIGREMMGQPPESANLYGKNLDESVDEETVMEVLSEKSSSKDEASISTPRLHCGTSEFPPGAPKSLYYETFGLIPPPTAASGFPRRLLGMPPVAASDQLWVQGQLSSMVGTTLPSIFHRPYPPVHPAHSQHAEDILDDSEHGTHGNSSPC